MPTQQACAAPPPVRATFVLAVADRPDVGIEPGAPSGLASGAGTRNQPRSEVQEQQRRQEGGGARRPGPEPVRVQVFQQARHVAGRRSGALADGTAGRWGATGDAEGRPAVFGAAGFASPGVSAQALTAGSPAGERGRGKPALGGKAPRTCASTRSASSASRNGWSGRRTRTKGTPRASAIPMR